MGVFSLLAAILNLLNLEVLNVRIQRGNKQIWIQHTKIIKKKIVAHFYPKMPQGVTIPGIWPSLQYCNIDLELFIMLKHNTS